jgi:serine protease Do
MQLAKRTILGMAVWMALAAAALAQNSPADPRRTPAVDVFERYKDAVVYLTGPMVGERGMATEEFFEVPSRRVTMSLGSGFIVHEAGYILTNAHAADKPFYHEVTLANGLKLPAELLAVVRENDLALLKIESPFPLRAVKLARDNDLRIGEPVIVIGNPEGLLLTCTTGVVSARGRATKPNDLPDVVLRELIQTDAAINPGSSGGPWFNALGDVIAITTAQRRNSENIGFGVSVETIRKALPEMLDVERRWHLVTGLEFQPDGSCRVAMVGPGTPAAAAGLQTGDVLTSLDGKPLANRLDFSFALIGRRPGQTLQLTVVRDGKPARTALALAERPKPDGAALLKARFGMTAVPLDTAKAMATSMRVRRGVVIADVDQGPPWGYDRLKSPPLPGDVLARIDGIRPHDLEHVGLLLDRMTPGRKVTMVFLRRTGNTVTRIDLSVTP